MMRPRTMGRLAKVGIILVVLVVLGTGALLFLAGRLARANKDRLLAAAAANVGRDIRVGDIGVSLWGGFAVTLDDVHVADDPAFSADAFLTVERVALHLDITPLLWRTIRVRRLVLGQPHVTIVRGVGGRLNVQSLGARRPPQASAPATRTRRPGNVLASLLPAVHVPAAFAAGKEQTTSPPGLAAGAMVLVAREVRVNRGTLRFVDRMPPGAEIEAQAIDIAARDITWNSSSQVRLRVGTVRGLPVPLAAIDSTIHLTPRSAEVTELRLRVGSDDIAGSATVAAFAPLRARYRAEAPRLDIGRLMAAARAGTGPAAAVEERAVRLEDLQATGSAAVERGALTVTTEARAARLGAGGTSFEPVELRATWRPTGTTIEKLTTSVYGGTLDIHGQIDTPSPAPPRFILDTVIRGVDIHAPLAALSQDPPLPVRGTLDTTASVHGSGDDAQGLWQSLRGDGTFEIRNGAFTGVNIIDTVATHIATVPGLTALVDERVRATYAGLFGSRDTNFGTLRGRAALSGGTLHVTDLVLKAADYEVVGSGKVDAAGQIVLHATLRLSAALSDDLVGDREGADVLRDPQGQLSIPFHIAGTPPTLGIRVEVSRFVPRAPAGALEEAIGGALRDILEPDDGH